MQLRPPQCIWRNRPSKIDKQDRRWLYFVSLLLLLFVSSRSFGQDTPTVAKDTTKKDEIVDTTIDTLTIRKDSVTDEVNDNSVLDIGANRGVYIQSEDKQLELRILGSIRAVFNYTDEDLEDHQTLNPYEVNTHAFFGSPNYFAGLQQTRIGLEVTRLTSGMGEVFMRIESDFRNENNSMRLRHAYGTIGSFLVGQSWTLLNNAGYQPLIVSTNGPVGDIGIRTPQVRYTKRYDGPTSWSIALEYSPPDINLPDSVGINILQNIPNLTSRYTYNKENISVRLAAIGALITGQVDDGQLRHQVAWGVSVALKHQLGKGTIFTSINTGRGIAQYLSVFKNKGEVVAFNADEKKATLLYSTSGYVAYEHNLPGNFSVSASFGVASIHDRNIEAEDGAYHFSMNFLANLFWQPTAGTRLGFEYGLGYREDVDHSSGMANRISVLAYYDF